MKLGERTFGNTNMDYHFLRDNGVCAKTTMRMIGLAYLENEV